MNVKPEGEASVKLEAQRIHISYPAWDTCGLLSWWRFTQGFLRSLSLTKQELEWSCHFEWLKAFSDEQGQWDSHYFEKGLLRREISRLWSTEMIERREQLLKMTSVSSFEIYTIGFEESITLRYSNEFLGSVNPLIVAHIAERRNASRFLFLCHFQQMTGPCMIHTVHSQQHEISIPTSFRQQLYPLHLPI